MDLRSPPPLTASGLVSTSLPFFKEVVYCGHCHLASMVVSITRRQLEPAYDGPRTAEAS